MKIAQVAPLIESVPPRLYGGTERIVSYLTEELVRLGHDVTLFASGDSITSAELAPCCTRALRLDPTVRDTIPHFMLMIDKVRERVDEFDILHFHIDLFHFPLFRGLAARTLTTLHGRQDLGDLKPFYSRFGEMPLVSISNDQRKPLPHANFVATIHHGIPADLHRPSFEPGGYLAFLGRISPEKRPDRAIRIARAAGIPLKIAAKVDKVDEDYFRNDILPLIDDPGVEFVGEINEREKTKFLGEAAALLFPVDWPEPFGLVMIEAMACGTPVLAFHSGSVPEVIDDGVTFKWKDYRVEGPARYKVMTLATGEFIRRFLMHVVPAGFHRIRYYGLLASSKRAENIARARELLTPPMIPIDAIKAISGNAGEQTAEPQPERHPCPCCGGPMIIIERFERGCQPKHQPSPVPAAIRIDTS